jgi:hypothetical protein
MKKGEEAAEGKFEVSTSLSMRFKERSHFCDKKDAGEAAVTDLEAIANYKEDLYISQHGEGGSCEPQIFSTH